MKIIIITIKLPFLLKWLKGFVRLETIVSETPKTLTGRKIDLLIIDEAKEIRNIG